MPYITKGRARSWEIRESVATRRGPRSRTLATFSELDEPVLAHAESRATKPLDREALCRQALTKGAPVAEPAINRAARTLLTELAHGERLPPALADLVADALGSRSRPSATARSAGEWLAADAQQRGEALEDLLLLADAIPPVRRRGAMRYPRLVTKAA